jgi:hypothetical protein
MQLGVSQHTCSRCRPLSYTALLATCRFSYCGTRLRHLAGGELVQIQFLLWHVSIQTTERYLGCKQKLRCAVNDRLGIEPNAAV